MAEIAASEPAAAALRGRRLQPGQRAELHLFDIGSGTSRLLFATTDRLVEAPNWHPNGSWIVVNADGVLFRARVDVPTGLDPVPATGLPAVNNDHMLSSDGRFHIVSANDGHLYRLPWEGGAAERITSAKDPDRRFRHFLHGISPDGQTLAYVGTEQVDGDEWAKRALWTLDLKTGNERLVGNGFSPADGPEFSPDGAHLYFNSETNSAVPGHAQLFRIALADGTVEQLTEDERVNWFPHPSPDGRFVSYLSYPPGTLGHPADLPVHLKLLDLSTGESEELVHLPGGQGTINVNSWSPDSRVLAYVAYPIAAVA